MPPHTDQTCTPPGSTRGETVTLTCPACGTTLQTAAARSVEGPCPMCGRLLRYEAPARAELAHFQPLRHHTHKPAFEGKRSPRKRRPHHRPLRMAIHNANEFINTRAGQLVVSTVLILLMVCCIALFSKRGQKRRGQGTQHQRVEPAESLPPIAPAPILSRLPDASPPEPEPDPFMLSPGQVLEVRKPAQ